MVGRNAHTEAFFQLIAKGAPNKILSFYFPFCEIAQVQPVHQVRHGVLEGEQVARVLLCSCFNFNMFYYVLTTSLLRPYCVLILPRPHHVSFEHVQNLTKTSASIKTSLRPYYVPTTSYKTVPRPHYVFIFRT